MVSSVSPSVSTPQVSSSNTSQEASPFGPFLNGLAQKYAPRFSLDPGSMKAVLASILDLETGNQARFIPQSADQKYYETGDSGNGQHAWQIDKRYHSSMNRPMTIEDSGDYAISKVLLVGFQTAQRRGVADPIVAAARYYNGGPKALNDDSRTTNNYGARFQTAYARYSQAYGGKPLSGGYLSSTSSQSQAPSSTSSQGGSLANNLQQLQSSAANLRQSNTGFGEQTTQQPRLIGDG